MQRISLPDALQRPLSFYLAMEEYVAAAYGCGFFVWRVPPTVIIGRNQDLESEVNLPFCREHGVRVVRRKSGGGCVYADLGNLMLSYITPQKGVELVFGEFLGKLCSFLSGLGLEAVRSEHNDVLVGGRKVSGNAFFVHPKASIVHGTLLHLSISICSSRPLRRPQPSLRSTPCAPCASVWPTSPRSGSAFPPKNSRRLFSGVSATAP